MNDFIATLLTKTETYIEIARMVLNADHLTQSFFLVAFCVYRIFK